MPPNAFRVIGQLSHIKASVCVCVDTQDYRHTKSWAQLLHFSKAFFFFFPVAVVLIGRRVVVAHRPRRLPRPGSCLSSQRRRVAGLQPLQGLPLLPARGLCSPRCGCPTASPPLRCTCKTWARSPHCICSNKNGLEQLPDWSSPRSSVHKTSSFAHFSPIYWMWCQSLPRQAGKLKLELHGMVRPAGAGRSFLPCTGLWWGHTLSAMSSSVLSV